MNLRFWFRRRLEGIKRPLRIDDFPGWGDTNDISGGLTEVAYDLSAVQIVVVQWEAAQRQDTVLLLAHVLHRAAKLGTSFKVRVFMRETDRW